MSTQPEALRLAEQLEAIGLRGPVAAELRPLAAVESQRDALLGRADTLQRWYDQHLDRLAAVEAQRDALLGVLRTIKDTKRLAREMQQQWCPAAQGMVRMASAAIKAVKGEKA